MLETRSPSASREDRAQHGVWPCGERDSPLARELDRDRSLVARRIDLDADAHRRARPAIDHDAARLEDLEATPVLEAPLRERVGARGSAVRGGSAELADEERRSVGEAWHGERDVIEAVPSHPRLDQDGERAALDQGEVDLGAE